MTSTRSTNCLGGEKQRLAISRLILKDPPLIFFDEAVSKPKFLGEEGRTNDGRRRHLTRTQKQLYCKTSTVY